MELWTFTTPNCSWLCQPRFQPRHCNSSAITSPVRGAPGHHMTICSDRCESKGWSNYFLEKAWPWQNDHRWNMYIKDATCTKRHDEHKQPCCCWSTVKNIGGILEEFHNQKRRPVRSSPSKSQWYLLHSIVVSSFLLIPYILGTNISPCQGLHWFFDFLVVIRTGSLEGRSVLHIHQLWSHCWAVTTSKIVHFCSESVMKIWVIRNNSSLSLLYSEHIIIKSCILYSYIIYKNPYIYIYIYTVHRYGFRTIMSNSACQLAELPSPKWAMSSSTTWNANGD